MLAEDNRLKKKKDFKKVYKYGKSSANKILVLYLLKNNDINTKIGISVSKKVGNAVIRNKIKRVIREICRNNIGNLKKGYNLVFIARIKIVNRNYYEIEKGLKNLIEKEDLFEKN